MNKTYFIVTAPETKKFEITEKRADAEQIAHDWFLAGRNPKIEVVEEADLMEKEQEWLGLD